MSTLWITATQPGPLDTQRALDKARDSLHEQHQDDAVLAENWDPLHNSDLHPSEHNGWMFMENKPNQRINPRIRSRDPEVKTLTTYKHGITRNSIHLDENGNSYRILDRDPEGNSHVWSGPHSATEELSRPYPCRHMDKDGTTSEHMHNHYDQLAELGAAPDTSYNEDYIRERNRKMRDAGFSVIS